MSMYNPSDNLQDEAQVYQICLLTSLNVADVSNPDDGILLMYNALSQPTEVSYEPQETTAHEIYKDDYGYTHVTLEPVSFNGQNFVNNYNIFGIAIVIEDPVYGYVVHSVDYNINPFVIGPQTDNMVVFPEVFYNDYSEVSNINWS